MASKYSPDDPSGYKRKPRAAFVTARNELEYRLSVSAPSHYTWPGGYAQTASVESGDRSQRDVMFQDHAFMMALRTDDSRSVIRLNGGVEMVRELRAGDITYLPPGNHLNSVSSGSCHFVTVLIDPTFESSRAPDRPSHLPIILSATEAALAALLHRTAAALTRHGGPSPMEIESIAALLMNEVCDQIPVMLTDDATPVQRAWSAIRPVLDHIERRIDTRLPLAELASVANLSLSQTARIARSFLGTSLHQYVLSRRIARACDLLANTHRPVSEIAALTGLSSQSHLTSLLSDHVGRSPASYRRALQPRTAAPR